MSRLRVRGFVPARLPGVTASFTAIFCNKMVVSKTTLRENQSLYRPGLNKAPKASDMHAWQDRQG